MLRYWLFFKQQQQGTCPLVSKFNDSAQLYLLALTGICCLHGKLTAMESCRLLMCKTNSFHNRLYVLLSFVYVLFSFGYALFSFGYALFSFGYVLFSFCYSLFSFHYSLFLCAVFMRSFYALFVFALFIRSFYMLFLCALFM